MADVNIFIPFVKSFEGGIANDKDDAGGFTKYGVTISTWKKVGYDKDGDGDIDENDLALIDDIDAFRAVLKPHYWDKWKADEIKSQSLANILVDWVWGSGVWGIKIPQRILGVKQDGIVGKQTLQALNSREPKELFEMIKGARTTFFHDCVKNRPQNAKFLKGWLRRLNSIGFGYLDLNSRTPKRITFNE